MQKIYPRPLTRLGQLVCTDLDNPQSPLPLIDHQALFRDQQLFELLAQYIIDIDSLLWGEAPLLYGNFTGDKGLIILLWILAFLHPVSAQLDTLYPVGPAQSFSNISSRVASWATLAVAIGHSFRKCLVQLHDQHQLLHHLPNTSPSQVLLDLMDQFVVRLGHQIGSFSMAICVSLSLKVSNL